MTKAPEWKLLTPTGGLRTDNWPKKELIEYIRADITQAEKEADAKVIEAAKDLKADVLEVQAYRAQCAHGSVNLSALALKMRAVEETLAAFNEALDAREKGGK